MNIEAKSTAATVSEMRAAGTPERLIFIFQHTGRIFTEESYKSIPTEVRREWDDASQALAATLGKGKERA